MSNLGDGGGIGTFPHLSDECPFCPVDESPRKIVSLIGKDNNSKTLGENLEISGDLKVDHLYFDDDFETYGRYSAEAHHLICGNEVLKEEAELETYLIKQGKSTSSNSDGKLMPNDVGYDVNHANNGVWLPSVPDMYRVLSGKSPEIWWGNQTDWNRKNKSKPARISLEAWKKADAAFIVMEAVKRQFHKSAHGSVGEPHNNYVEEALVRLRELTTICQNYSKVCPMKNGEVKDGPPFVPPYRLIGMLDGLSAGLERELIGPPESWDFFISEYALRCAKFWKRELAL